MNLKMAAEKKENSKKEQAAPENIVPAEDLPGELRAPIWSVVSFEKLEAGGLNYAEAEKKLKKLLARGVSGLCIVTDEAAARIVTKSE